MLNNVCATSDVCALFRNLECLRVSILNHQSFSQTFSHTYTLSISIACGIVFAYMSVEDFREQVHRVEKR